MDNEDFNECRLSGTVKYEPKFLTSKNGVEYARFTIGSRSGKKSAFIPVTIFGDDVAILRRDWTEGCKVEIHGNLSSYKPEGQKYYSVNVVANGLNVEKGQGFEAPVAPQEKYTTNEIPF